MGLKGPPISNGAPKVPPMMVLGKKRSMSFTAVAALPNKRNLSQAKLQRIFVIMMGAVFAMWSTLTIVLVRKQHSDVFLHETNSMTLGPPSLERNKNEIIRERFGTSRPRLSTKVDSDASGRKEAEIIVQRVSLQHDSHNLDMEEMDIHEMIHPNQIKKGKSPSRILKAHLEPIYFNDWETKPLPVRNVTEKDLITIEYPRVNSCRRLPELWPIDDYPDVDAFLPWIHDVFPTDDGKFIQFVAQNKRRCQSGTTPDQVEILEKMQPQVSLFQHVPLKRMSGASDEETRYRLSSHEDADPDGLETRFICTFSDGQETLSQFDFNYDYVAKRKNHKKTASKEGHNDNKSIHTSQLIFKCPVPESLVSSIREGTSVINDQATLFLSLTPVRTPPRYGAPDRFLPAKYEWGKSHQNFSVPVEWGDSHVLPRVKDSGRWENIPICLPTYKAFPDSTAPPPKEIPTEISVGTSLLNSTNNTKKNRVVACTWASTSYSTRGERFAINDGTRRADEWIRFHLLTGVDHIYIYDNSLGEKDLKEVTDQFPGKVTRIRWPARICNNNRSFHDSPGDRSSQYAAESSCRLRFGPHTDWMANMDIDEFVAPVGNYTSIKPFLNELDDKGTKIVSFGSWRAWPRRDFIEPPVAIVNKTVCDVNLPCFHLKVPDTKSILQTYNCDRQKVKTETMPAEKQIYRTDYVLQHFVHFSTVTKYTVMNKEEMVASGLKGRVAPDPLSRFANERTEVTMLHTKAVATQDTAGWEKRCSGEMKGSCRIGNPFPDGDESVNVTKDSDGWLYNCYVNPKIENFWVPLLNEELKKSKIIDFQAIE